MTILISSDWQLCDNPLNAYRHEFQKQLRAIVKKHDVKLLLMLGDLTEQKDRHGAWLVNKVVDHLDRLRALCSVVIVQGNHDYVAVTSPFYQFVRHFSGISWVNEPTDANGAHMDLAFAQLGNVMLLPHTVDWEKSWAKIKLKNYDWVFAHMTFQGAFAGHGMQLRGVRTSIFKDGATVISGDIHAPQVLNTENKTHVEYVGAPYLCDFGDDYQPRVMLLDGTTLTSIPVTGPQKRLVEIVSLDDLKTRSLARVNGLQCGDILKIRVTITNDQRAEWPAIKAKVREWGEANDYLIHVVQPVLLDTEHRMAKRAQHKQQSDDDLLRTYAKHRQIDKLTLKAGMSLLRRV